MRKLRYMLMAACVMALASCGHNNDDPVINTFSSYTFTIDLEETGANQDLVLTSIQYTDYKGNTVKEYVTPDEDGFYQLVSHAYTSVPASYTIVLTQELSSSISYDQSNYAFGLAIDAAIESVDVSGNTINRRTANDTYNFVCTQSKLSSNFPRTTYIKYTVSKLGAVTISIN